MKKSVLCFDKTDFLYEIIDAEKMNTDLSEYVYEEEAKYIHDFLNSVKLSKELKLIMRLVGLAGLSGIGLIRLIRYVRK